MISNEAKQQQHQVFPIFSAITHLIEEIFLTNSQALKGLLILIVLLIFLEGL